jgi:uncharacterized membrane protein
VQSAVKGIVWRFFSSCITVAVVLVAFGDSVRVEQALALGGAEAVLKFLVYFAYERVWLLLRKVQVPAWPP